MLIQVNPNTCILSFTCHSCFYAKVKESNFRDVSTFICGCKAKNAHIHLCRKCKSCKLRGIRAYSSACLFKILRPQIQRIKIPQHLFAVSNTHTYILNIPIYIIYESVALKVEMALAVMCCERQLAKEVRQPTCHAAAAT